MKFEFYRHIFEKYSDIKFHENPSVLTDRQTDVTKLIVAFRNFATAPETNAMCEFYELLKNIDFDIF
jgi:hypothetical protein